MHSIRWAALSAFFAAGCQTYAPAPVDLQAHARLFADRIPDAELVRAFAQSLRQHDPAIHGFDVGDGLSLEEARYVALLFNPSLKAVRAQAAVAKATAELAGPTAQWFVLLRAGERLVMKTKFLSLLAASFLFAACGKEEHVHTPGDGHSKEAGHVDDHGGGGHGAMVSLGSIQLGGVAVEVEQEGAVEAGKEVGVEISCAKDKPLVGTVRAWVGIESAAGSMKAKLGSGDHMHGHLDVPKPLPEGSKFWFEVEGAAGTSKASIGFRK